MDTIQRTLAAPEAMIARRSRREVAVARVELLTLLLYEALDCLDDDGNTLDGGMAAYPIDRLVREAIRQTEP